MKTHVLRDGVILLTFAWHLACQTAVAEEIRWTSFRGVSGDGHAPHATPPEIWSEGKNIRWKTAIQGKGWSSPVAWDEQIWLTTATDDGTQMFAICVNLEDGTIEHERLVFENAEPRFCHPTNSYASPTPVIEAGRVYVHFGSYGTACIDTMTGEKLWEQRSLACDHWRGPGSSPIVDEQHLYVAFDGYDVQYVAAMDKQTGDVAWISPRKIDYDSTNGDHKKAYSTAQLIDVDGTSQLISPSAAATIAYRPDTGEEIWRVRHGGMNAASRPVFAHGLVYLSTGDAVGAIKPALVAVRPQAGIDDRIAWSVARSAPKRPSPLIVGDLLFTIGDDGVAMCLDAATGDEVWRKRVPGNYRASPIYAGGRIYLCNLEGVTTVIAADRDFQQVAVNTLDDGFQASPCAIGRTLLLRSTKHLYAIEQP